MKGSSNVRLAILLCALVLWVQVSTAAEKKAARVIPAATPATVYRMSQLEDAKKRAIKEQKPIAWIASSPEFLVPVRDPMSKGSHAATSYAVRALQNDVILVFSDGRVENHQEPPIVDHALHTPDPHYMVPGVIILTPSLDKVICNIPPNVSDPQERVRGYTEALKKIRNKASWPQ